MLNMKKSICCFTMSNLWCVIKIELLFCSVVSSDASQALSSGCDVFVCKTWRRDDWGPRCTLLRNYPTCYLVESYHVLT